MLNNKKKVKSLKSIKSHSHFVEEEPNIDDICVRMQSTNVKTTDNMNYERENTITPKKENSKCSTHKSNSSSLVSNSLSANKHSVNFIEKFPSM